MSSCVYRLRIPVYHELLDEKKAKLKMDIGLRRVRIIPKAQNYLAMVEAVERLPYFTEKIWQQATVGQMNNNLRFWRNDMKAKIQHTEELVEEVKKFKKRKGQVSMFDMVDFPILMRDQMLLQRVTKSPEEVLTEEKEKLSALKREDQVAKFLQGMINNPCFFKSLY